MTQGARCRGSGSRIVSSAFQSGSPVRAQVPHRPREKAARLQREAAVFSLTAQGDGARILSPGGVGCGQATSLIFSRPFTLTGFLRP